VLNSTIYDGGGQVGMQPQSGLSSLSTIATYQRKAATTFGIKPHSITLSYLIRALFYATVGLIAAVLVFKYVVIPVEIRHPFYFPFGPAFLTIVFSRTVFIASILLVVSLVAAFIPVWRVMRIKILDAIWG